MWAPGGHPGFWKGKDMSKLTIVIALLAAVVATFGQLNHPSNPLPTGGILVQTTPEWPLPFCPPDC